MFFSIYHSDSGDFILRPGILGKKMGESGLARPYCYKSNQELIEFTRRHAILIFWTLVVFFAQKDKGKMVEFSFPLKQNEK